MTRYFVLYLGWTLDFMPTVWSLARPPEKIGLEAAPGGLRPQDPCTNARRQFGYTENVMRESNRKESPRVGMQLSMFVVAVVTGLAFCLYIIFG